MKILIIPDKFKGSLTAEQVIDAITAGLKDSLPEVQPFSIIASDGGDGFLNAICQSNPSVQQVHCATTDPLGRPIDAVFGWDAGSESAYIEMARASGMELLQPQERNPELTSTLGTGTMIINAIERGAERIYVGLGGSATNDGGTGIAQALGYRFLDHTNATLPPTGGSLRKIHRIDRTQLHPKLDAVAFCAINDVRNPLLGAEGAAIMYSPQKGATAEQIPRLEQGLANLDRAVKRDLGIDAAEVPGSGAAGGTGFGLKAFANAQFISGTEFVLSQSEAQALLESGEIDFIWTGEGKIDDQTGFGKLVFGVAEIGKQYNVPVLAVCGRLDLQHTRISDLGLQDVLALSQQGYSLEQCIDQAGPLVRQLIAQWAGDVKQSR
ncbi:MAG: hypothetical protein CBB71_11410 [Rhodopirellula sp. TMED11]|nr:MAG: hypothetical protein CBB71_11410 [Rhodopirellula sp. TMED11]